MNVILVVFDSLRKDCVGAYGQPPWGKVHTPHLDAFAREAVAFDRAYPESLPTRRALYTGRRVYPFHNGDFHLKGDFVGAAGWRGRSRKTRTRWPNCSRRWAVAELRFFGSAQRDDFGPDSDVDILATPGPDAAWSLLDRITMEQELGAVLGRKVDLVTRRAVEASRNKERRRAILDGAEVIYAT